MTGRGLVAGFRNLERAEDGERIVVHLAPVVRRVLPVVGVRCTMPWILWKAYIPGQSVEFAWGSALSPEGAMSKAWRSFDAWVLGRRRGRENDQPFSGDDLRRLTNPEE